MTRRKSTVVTPVKRKSRKIEAPTDSAGGSVRKKYPRGTEVALANFSVVLMWVDFRCLSILANLESSYGSKTIYQAEEQAINETMRNAGHNIKKASIALGVSRTTLYRKLEKYNICTHDRSSPQS